MLKLSGSTSIVLALVVGAGVSVSEFARYKRLEAYEAKPGILVIPKYAGDGQVCEIELEQRRYVDGVAAVDATLPVQATAELIDQLAPPQERGPRTVGVKDRIMQNGNSTVTFGEYKNISIQSYGNGAGNAVVLIRWKNRVCKD
jgi:hypothetical protein